MQTIKIDLTLLALNAKYSRNNQDKYDLSALIALSLSKQAISRGERTLTELRNPVPPLTTIIRNRSILTPIGYEILLLSSFPPLEQIARANRLLAPHSITLLPEKGCGLPNRSSTPKPTQPEYIHNYHPTN